MLRMFFVFLFVIVVFCSNICGQIYNPSYYGPGIAAYRPQIDVVSSGVNYDVQAVVSHDRKYVTLNMRPQLSNVVAMQTFAVGSGLVGNGLNSVLNKDGVTKLD